MELISIEGIVVSTLNYGENSKILNVLTRDKGIIGVISKGCLKEKSKLRVVSGLYTYAVFHVNYKKDGKLSTLTGADVIDYFINIRSDLEKIGYLGYLVDLAKNVYKQHYDEGVYDILISALKKIEGGFNPKVITNIVEIKYLSYLGVSLYLDGCVQCGIGSIATLSLKKGGYVCARHLTGERIYDSSMLKMIKAYYYVDIDKISELKLKNKLIDEIDEFLGAYYKEYTGLYLKNKNIIDNIKSS